MNLATGRMISTPMVAVISPSMVETLALARFSEYSCNRGKVAEKLRISRQTLWHRMKRLGLNGEESQRASQAAR